jgi:hypothetical protein
MITAAAEVLEDAGIDLPLHAVLADGGYWNSAQITALGQRDIQAIVATKAATRSAPRTLSARQGPQARRIEKRMDTPEGAALYRRRQQIIEPVFANTKFLRRIDRFQRRGLTASKTATPGSIPGSPVPVPPGQSQHPRAGTPQRRPRPARHRASADDSQTRVSFTPPFTPGRHDVGGRTVIGTWDARWTREQREDAIAAAKANLREKRQELDETLAEIQAKGLAIEHAAKWLAVLP